MREGGRKGRFGVPRPPCTVADLGSSRIRPSVVGGAAAWLACHRSAWPRAHFLSPTQGDLRAGEGPCCPNVALGMLLAGCLEAASADDAHFTVWESCYPGVTPLTSI